MVGAGPLEGSGELLARWGSKRGRVAVDKRAGGDGPVTAPGSAGSDCGVRMCDAAYSPS